MKHYRAITAIVVGGILIIWAFLVHLNRSSFETGVHPVGLALGIVGVALVWRGIVLRYPSIPPSRRKPDTTRGEWTHRSGTAKPSFLNKPDAPADQAPPVPDAPRALQE